MSDFKLPSLFACSVSFCMAATSPPLKSELSENSELQGREFMLPNRESPLRHGKPENLPTPTENPITPTDEDSDESPSGEEENADCDECVLVLGPSESGIADQAGNGVKFVTEPTIPDAESI